MSTRPAPGTFALMCPRCEARPIETAQRFSIIRGAILSSRSGEATVVGCRACVRTAGRRHALANLALGWWSFPWGLMTPIAVGQNVIAMFASPPGSLDTVLRQLGLDPDAWRYDEYGLITEEWNRLYVAAAAFGFFANVAGLPLDPERVVGLLVDLSDDRIPPDAARQLLGSRVVPRSAVLACEPGIRDGLLWLIADFVPTDRPQDFLEAIRATAAWLVCSDDTVTAVFEALAEHLSRMPAGDIELELAYATLELDATADKDAVQRSYKRLLLRWHPDRAITNNISVEGATARTQTIVAAYRTVTTARGW